MFDYGYATGNGGASSATSQDERNAVVLAALANAREGGGGWARINCPFCLDRVGKVDTKRCLSVRVDSGKYHCFRCGARGCAVGADDVVEPRARDGGVAPSVNLGPPDGFVPFGRSPSDDPMVLAPARAYLSTRRLAEGVVVAAGIGACVTGEFAGRIVVPTLDEHRRWLGWVGRDYTGRNTLPYYTCSGMPKADMLYNQAAVFVETTIPLYVVEGVFDALALWPNAVAVWGKPSVGHESILLRSCRPVVIVLDGDAWRESEAMMWRLRVDGHERCGFVRLPPTKDPDDVSKEWLDEEAKRSLAR